MNPPLLRPTPDVLFELLDVAGKRVVDVGCGDGGLTRRLAKAGARATGIEITEDKVARARAAPAVADESYAVGRGEALSVEDGSLDAIVYLNSLHHVPVASQTPALVEARRALAAGGALLVIEPLAEGAYFELVRPLEDETEVRAHAYSVIGRAADFSFTAEREVFYRAPLRFSGFEEFAGRVVAVDPARRTTFEAMEDDLRAAFLDAAEQDDSKGETVYRFEQPMRANLLRAR